MADVVKRKTARRRYACAVCGRKDTAENMVYSRHTGNRFCWDYGACLRRRRRRR